MKHLEGMSITKLLQMLQTRITTSNVTHRSVENDVVAEKARLIWLKLIEVVSYWHQLPKNKQPGLKKPGINTSYDHLCKAVKDCLVSVKVLFFEEVAKKLNVAKKIAKKINFW